MYSGVTDCALWDWYPCESALVVLGD